MMADGGGGGPGAATWSPTGIAFTGGTVLATDSPIRRAMASPLRADLEQQLDAMLTRLGVPPQSRNGRAVTVSVIADILRQNPDPARVCAYPLRTPDPELSAWRAASIHADTRTQLRADWAITAKWALRALAVARVDQLAGLGHMLGIAEANLRLLGFGEADGDGRLHEIRSYEIRGEPSPLFTWVMERYRQHIARGTVHREACKTIWNDAEYQAMRDEDEAAPANFDTMRKQVERELKRTAGTT